MALQHVFGRAVQLRRPLRNVAQRFELRALDVSVFEFVWLAHVNDRGRVRFSQTLSQLEGVDFGDHLVSDQLSGTGVITSTKIASASKARALRFGSSSVIWSNGSAKVRPRK